MKLSLLLLLLITSACSSLSTQSSKKFSILQGITNAKEVEFSIVTKESHLSVTLQNPEGHNITPSEQKTISQDFSSWKIHKVYFQREDESYSLLKVSSGRILDEREVGRGITTPYQVKLAIASCMDDQYEKDFKIWNHLNAQNPDYLLLIGDNVYADSVDHQATPKKIWDRYVETRTKLPLFYQPKLIASHALWDDHDYGTNNGNKNFEHKDESTQIFNNFFAQSFTSESYQSGFGVGGLLSLGEFNLYFLDSRSFRDAHKEGLHLGLDQEAWLFSKLKEENRPSLLIKGDQFFGGYHTYESFEGSHPDNFKSFIYSLKPIQTPFVFVSGDRHMSEIMQFPRSLFGRPSYEITSSPIHGKVYPESPEVNPWRVVSVENQSNYIIMNNKAENDHWFIDIESFSAAGEILFRREIAVYIKDLQDNLNELRKRRQYRRRPMRSKRR